MTVSTIAIACVPRSVIGRIVLSTDSEGGQAGGENQNPVARLRVLINSNHDIALVINQ